MSYFLIVSRLFFHLCRYPKVGHSPNVIFSYSFAVVFSSLYTYKGPQSYKKWLEETVMGHGNIGLLQARFFFPVNCDLSRHFSFCYAIFSTPLFSK